MGSLSIFSIVIMAVIIYLIYAAFRGVFGGRGATSATGHYICPACDAPGMIPVNTPRGQKLIRDADPQ